MNEKGTISVHTENIFPIIKKFLYSDQEVFLRELVANAVDAIQKRKQLVAMGIYEDNTARLQVKVTINENRKTLTISDQGIGMTAEEIKKYINQVAFSGASAFLEKYKDQAQQQQLIGCFGLGFYAAFMVADKVEIITQSYQKDAEAAHWTCDGTTSFVLNKTIKKEVGTDVVLHLTKDAEEFLQKERVQQILAKHCKFLPIEIEFAGKVINNPHPIWTKNPNELKDTDYLTFYKELYPFAEAPLFWIHLNVDYPFTLTGILYFPQINSHFAPQEKIQLYAKQVFITNEVKNIVPDFLMLLHGIIDSPDIPLNVSRSALQTDSNVKKINTYITKKVADKLALLFKEDRKAYEEKWDGIALFIKYGMLTDDKFYEKASEFALVKNTAQEYFTLAEYKKKIQDKQTDKNQNLVLLYTTAPEKQAIYIQACQQKAYDVLVLNTPIDDNFISLLEHKLEKITFKGVDTDTVEHLIDKDTKQESVLTEDEKKQLQAIYEKAIADKQVTWTVVAMTPDRLPITITVSEMAKRIQNTQASNPLAGHAAPLPLQAKINANHPLAKKLLSTQEATQHLAKQAYCLALLAQHRLQGNALAEFIQRSVQDLVAK